MAQAQHSPINPMTGNPYREGYNPGAPKGAILLSSRRTPLGELVVTGAVRSHTDQSRRYLIEANAVSGYIRCSCDAYTRAYERSGRHAHMTDPSSGWCKHIASWWESIAREIIERNAEVTK